MENGHPCKEHLEGIIKVLPDNPGVYQFYNAAGKIIYIGKAKNLKKRVSSYFNRDTGQSGKVTVMVKRIADIKYIVVASELDALLLENNLIKKYQPKYNINLKDDKTFPWICIKNEPFPRIFYTRNLIKDGSEYFGPYASVFMMKTLLDFVRQLYPIRTCSLNLSEKNITTRKYKVCLQYHIGNCKGPCEDLQTEADYLQTIAHIRNIIKGNINAVIQGLTGLMMEHAGKMEFEKAQQVKEKIALLENYRSKSTIVNPKITNVDVFSFSEDDDSAYVNFLKVVDGAIIQSHTVELKKALEETREELLTLAVLDLRTRFGSESSEIIVPFPPEVTWPEVAFTVPKIGDKKQLMELSERNLKYYILEKQKQADLVDPERHSRRLLNQAMKDLRMKELPVHIECFDNSNILGEHAVAAMVCFKNGKPSKADYRHFNIKTVEGPDDFASMEEIVFRRYYRLLKENQPLPQLIVIDGGKGQLNAAYSSLEKLELNGKITIIGIAKRLEELYYPDDPVPLYLDKKSETLRLIQYLRDEAHRFGITHHRKKRSKATIKTDLTKIPGIGPKTAEMLLKKFRSIKGLREASPGEIEKVAGPAKARFIKEFLDQL